MMPSNRSATKPKSNDRPRPVWEWSFTAIGTDWWVGIYDAYDDPEKLQHKIITLIDDFDDTYSRFRAGSLVSRMSEKAGTYQLPPNAVPLLRMYRELYESTGGRVTPLVGQLLADAGYDANYTLRSKHKLPSVPAWDDILSLDGSVLTVRKPALLDFGAAGKGYLVDLVAGLLEEESVEQYCVDAGGDMYCRGMNVPLTIGLEDPADPTQVIGVARVVGRALCGSAPNRRAWGEYHHIMDPASRRSTNNVKAVWAVADTAMLADGLTTALFFTEPEQLRKRFKFEYALVYADGRLRYSPDFPATFFTKEQA
ncbi:MAG TPA: FAD:protein FMN transferase [Candidatus Saccharimonadales bacterium]